MRTHREWGAGEVGGLPALPRPESGRMETWIMGTLCVVTAYSVLRFLGGVAGFAERAPELAARIEGWNPALVERVMASRPTNQVPRGPRMAGPAAGGSGGVPAASDPAG